VHVLGAVPAPAGDRELSDANAYDRPGGATRSASTPSPPRDQRTTNLTSDHLLEATGPWVEPDTQGRLLRRVVGSNAMEPAALEALSLRRRPGSPAQRLTGTNS
jgi:hypothetical protein